MIKLSIIVPMYNAGETIEQCLKAILPQLNPEDELLVIDDFSCDLSASLVRAMNVSVLSSKVRRGVSASRNAGIDNTKNEFVVFIDADVVIGPSCFTRIREIFGNKQADAVTGLLASVDCGLGFFSHYKNIYMNQLFQAQIGHVSFLYGSLCAFSRFRVGRWDEAIAKGEDTALGLQIVINGGRIVLDKELEVTHLKKYTLMSLLKNDFLIPYAFADSFSIHLRNRQSANTSSRFSHVLPSQILSIQLVAIILLSLISSFFILSFLLFLVWGILNRRFILTLVQHYPSYSICIPLFIFLDQFVMGMGILCGLPKIVKSFL